MTKMTDGIADEAWSCSYRDHYGFDNESQSIVQLPNVTAVRFTNNEIKGDLSSSQSSVTHFEMCLYLLNAKTRRVRWHRLIPAKYDSKSLKEVTRCFACLNWGLYPRNPDSIGLSQNDVNEEAQGGNQPTNHTRVLGGRGGRGCNIPAWRVLWEPVAEHTGVLEPQSYE